MNFVIFMPDEMRADAAGCYGHPLVQTPHLDRLAAEGTRFDLCYAQHPVCSPSRCSMLTGWYPHVAGHRTLWHLLRPHEPNLLKTLKQAGYDVRMYGKNDVFATESFPDSVTEARGGKGRKGQLLREGEDDPLYDSFLAGPCPGDEWSTNDGDCVRQGIEFLRSPHEQPFMLYLPLTFPHPPYSAPQPWHDMYDPADVPDLRGADGTNKPLFHRLIRETRGLHRISDDDFRKMSAVYYGMITYSDHLLGELLRALDETDLASDTCVLFLTDHGDWAGEFGLVEKWPSALDDTIIRVPLVIRAPGGEAGHVVDTPVELFDIMPTILELADLQTEHTHFAESLVEQLHGAPGDAGRAAFAEGGYDPHEPHCFEGKPSDGLHRDPSHIYYQKAHLQQIEPASVCRSVMVRTKTHKLIARTNDTGELYNMQADPREMSNLYGTPDAADVQADLERRLLQFYLRTSDAVPPDADPRGYERGSFPFEK